MKKILLLLVALCLVTVSAGCISFGGEPAENTDTGGILGLFGDSSGGMSGDLMSMALAQGDMSAEDMAMLESLMSGDYASLMQNTDSTDTSGDYQDYSDLMQGMDYSNYYQNMGSDPYDMAYSESGMNAEDLSSLMSLLSSGSASGYSPLDIITSGNEEDMDGMTAEEMAMLESYLSSYGGLF